jgi:predicted nucleic acid-binding Zn ribbon protein
MERLDRDLRATLGRLGGSGDADLAAIVEVWPALVGEQNARRSWPARIGRDGTLHVHTADSVWAHQLGMLAPDIRARLAERLGRSAPASLRFAPGPLPAPGDLEPARRPRIAEAGPEERVEAASIASGIEDEELRELVARAAAASLARARSDRGF